MKFFHLSDLHIGKQLHHYNLREDQEHILAEVLSYAASIHPDAIVIAGDIYDKSVPSAEAVSLFDEFLTALAKIEPVIPVLIISGNHDSAQRLDYASRLLGSHQIYIAGQAPEEEADRLLVVSPAPSYDFAVLSPPNTAMAASVASTALTTASSVYSVQSVIRVKIGTTCAFGAVFCTLSMTDFASSEPTGT